MSRFLEMSATAGGVTSTATSPTEQGETTSSYFDKGGFGKVRPYTIVLHSWSWA